MRQRASSVFCGCRAIRIDCHGGAVLAVGEPVSRSVDAIGIFRLRNSSPVAHAISASVLRRAVGGSNCYGYRPDGPKDMDCRANRWDDAEQLFLSTPARYNTDRNRVGRDRPLSHSHPLLGASRAGGDRRRRAGLLAGAQPMVSRCCRNVGHPWLDVHVSTYYLFI
jgi:hypothetical protein